MVDGSPASLSVSYHQFNTCSYSVIPDRGHHVITSLGVALGISMTAVV